MEKGNLKRVLILEENTDHLELLTALLEDRFSPIDIHTVETIEDCLEFLEQTAYDLIMTGYFISNSKISERLHEIIELSQGAPIIVISGSGDEHIAAEMIKLGASDYIVKNRKSLEKLPPLISKYFKKERAHKDAPLPSPAETTTRILREIDRLMQKARLLTTEIATKPKAEEGPALDAIFSQIKRLRKMIQEQK